MFEAVIPRTLLLESWRAQDARWPKHGRHVLAQFDNEKVVVYQAYNPAIADFAARHHRLAGAPGFGLGRMSWVKPNFLWMMYRSGWARKPGQERVLAIHLGRATFERILAIAAWTRFEPAVHESEDVWRAELAQSPVRLQWDPDHGPGGNPLERRAIQLGLSGEVLAEFASTAIRDVEDVTPFVHAQDLARRADLNAMMTPQERIYPVTDRDVSRRLFPGER